MMQGTDKPSKKSNIHIIIRAILVYTGICLTPLLPMSAVLWSTGFNHNNWVPADLRYDILSENMTDSRRTNILLSDGGSTTAVSVIDYLSLISTTNVFCVFLAKIASTNMVTKLLFIPVCPSENSSS